MDKVKLEYFKDRLLKYKQDLEVRLENFYKKQEFRVRRSDLADDGDHANSEIGIDLNTEVFERYRKILGEVNEALTRINDGTYGICELYGTDIDEKRLELQPWVRYSIQAQEELELKEKQYRKIEEW